MSIFSIVFVFRAKNRRRVQREGNQGVKLLQNYYFSLFSLLFKSLEYENDASIMHEEDNGKKRTRLENPRQTLRHQDVMKGYGRKWSAPATAGARNEKRDEKRDDKKIEKAKIDIQEKGCKSSECEGSGGKDKKNKQCNKTQRIFKCKVFSPHPSSFLQRKTHTDRCDSFV